VRIGDENCIRRKLKQPIEHLRSGDWLVVRYQGKNLQCGPIRRVEDWYLTPSRCSICNSLFSIVGLNP
jgi:hypothetical protein